MIGHHITEVMYLQVMITIDKIRNYIVILQVKIANVNVPTQHTLATCIESTSIVIVVITTRRKQLHAFRLALQIAEVYFN